MFHRQHLQEAEIDRKKAEIIALNVLAWIATHDDLLNAFLGATGADKAELAAQAENSEFLGFLLDFLMSSDAYVIEYARHAGMPPESIPAARAALPGGDLPNWT